MKINNICALFLALCICTVHYPLSAKKPAKYKKYYLSIIRAEKAFVNGHSHTAFLIYDKIFQSDKYKPFVFELYNAAQFAYISGDTVRFLKYITYAANNGMPEGAFYAAPIFRELKNRSRDDKLILSISKAFKGEHYIPPITYPELKILNEYNYQLDSLHAILGNATEQTIKSWVKTETDFRKYLVKEFLSQGKFPSEKLMGFADPRDSTQPVYHAKKSYSHASFTVKSTNRTKKLVLTSKAPDSLRGKINPINRNKPTANKTPEAQKSKITLPKHIIESQNIVDIDTIDDGSYSLYSGEYAPFLHYSCTFKKYHKMLWEAVLNGYLPPKDYAMFEEGNVFKAFGSRHKDMSVDYCDYKLNSCYYNILGPSWYPKPMQTYIKTRKGKKHVERNRRRKLIRKYATELKMKDLASKYHLKLFFGFFSYR